MDQRTLGAIVECKNCGDAYFDKPQDGETPARCRFKATHGPNCTREKRTDSMPPEVKLEMLKELALWEPRVAQ